MLEVNHVIKGQFYKGIIGTDLAPKFLIYAMRASLSLNTCTNLNTHCLTVVSKMHNNRTILFFIETGK